MPKNKLIPNPTLKGVRAHAGITQQGAAELLGVTRGAYARWECGVRKTPWRTLSNFAGIVELLYGALPPELKRASTPVWAPKPAAPTNLSALLDAVASLIEAHKHYIKENQND